MTTDGTLDVRRVSFVGTWQGLAAERTLTRSTGRSERNGIALYTQALGADDSGRARRHGRDPVPVSRRGAEHRPRRAGRRGPHRRRTGADPARRRRPRRVAGRRGGADGGGAGRAARDDHASSSSRTGRASSPRSAAARRSSATAPPSSAPARCSRRASSAPRAPRSGVGQLADGRIILVAVDGRQPGYSVGMTNFELAQALVRLGAVTGMALDSGGSTTMAFDGTLLNRPSDGRSGRSRRRSLFQYTGVFVQPAVSVVSPDGDGVADRQSLRYKLVRPSTVTVTLTAPGRQRRLHRDAATRQPGSYAVPFPPPPTSADAGSARDARSTADPAARPLEARGHRRRRHRAAVRDEQSFTRQHDRRLPRHDARRKLFLPPARPRPRDHLEADAGRARRRHGRDAGRRGRAHARQALRTRPATGPSSGTASTGSDEGRQGRRVRRPRRRPGTRSARSSSTARRPRPADRRPQ